MMALEERGASRAVWGSRVQRGREGVRGVRSHLDVYHDAWHSLASIWVGNQAILGETLARGQCWLMHM